jgi:PKD repeat protein
VDYGDGSGVQPLSLKADKSVGLAHTYAASGSYTVTVGVTDKDGATGSAQMKVAVANLAPSVGPISGPLDPVALNSSIGCSALFADPGLTDTHTALWSWGDGASSPGVVTEAGGAGTVTGSHAYALAGVYEVTLTVSDQEGAAGTAVYDYLVAYDPTSGFVTGGGWISSAAGAYEASSAFTGKASFGFVSKYYKKATNPRGNTRFVLHGAGFEFKATAYDSLTVAGAIAQYKGSGTVGKAQGYSFFVTVLDGQVQGGGGIDKFRIKIWNTKTRAVVYDTQMGAADGAAPTTPLGGGSVVIHS